MQFGSMPDKETINAVFIFRRLLEEYHTKGKKLQMCSVGPQKHFESTPRNVLEFAIRKKGIADRFG